MYVNENGSRVIVGFGHASPLFEGRKDALGQACEQAGLKADQQIVMLNKDVEQRCRDARQTIQTELGQFNKNKKVAAAYQSN